MNVYDGDEKNENDFGEENVRDREDASSHVGFFGGMGPFLSGGGGLSAASFFLVAEDISRFACLGTPYCPFGGGRVNASVSLAIR